MRWWRRAARVLRRASGAVVVTVGLVTGAVGPVPVAGAGPAVAQVTLTPDSSQGPGGPQLQQLVNWLAGMGLIACVAALVFHAVNWGWGSQQHNLARVQDGKAGVARAAMVGLLIGAAAALVNFAVNLGGAVQ